MKILISDFDRTFFDDNYLNNIELVNKFVDAGNMFIIATGRSINNLKIDIQDYDIKYSYLICSDGASIYDDKHNNLFTCNIPQEFINPICNLLDNNSNISLTLIENDNFVSGTTANSIAAKFVDKNLVDSIVFEIKNSFPQLYIYQSDHYINIRNNEVSKAKAIAFLMNKYNISFDDIYTIGDSINDLEMCDKFNSFTFDYACDELKKVSNMVVGNFAQAIKKIV